MSPLPSVRVGRASPRSACRRHRPSGRLRWLALCMLVLAACGVRADDAAPAPQRGDAMFMLDYRSLRARSNPTLDLAGVHLLQRVADGAYLGVGAYAPVLRGEYGGFMAFDVGAHLQRPLWGPLFGTAGLSIGGGGGGRSNQHSAELSGNGRLSRAYAGLGYDFGPVALGAQVARMRFQRSDIDDTQVHLFLQIPFRYSVGSFADFGRRLDAADASARFGAPQGSTLTLGLDNYRQRDAKGGNKSTIRLVDLQFARDLAANLYWYASLGVGYGGLPLYNQLIGGLGYRQPLSPSLDLHAQLGLGSGGYAPDKIDTGAGLLVYPKLSLEYAINREFGLALTAGYMVAPDGSSKNATVGAALHYHLQSRRGTGDAGTGDGAVLRGYRFHLQSQTAVGVRRNDLDRGNVQMLVAQLDTVVAEHVYVPIRAGVALGSYLGYPGYGEVLAGIGVHGGQRRGDRVQLYGQVLAGANVHGGVLQSGVGLGYSLSDQWSVLASAGHTRALSSHNGNYRAGYAALGLSYRFAVPSW